MQDIEPAFPAGFLLPAKSIAGAKFLFTLSPEKRFLSVQHR
jgi:hypothetical protein